MRCFIYLISLLFILCSYGQNVTIQGFAKDTTNGKTRVSIVINDTLDRYEKSWDSLTFPEGTGDKIREKYSTRTKRNSDGYFSIKASIKDTLYFKSNSLYRFTTEKYPIKDLLKMDQIRIELEPEVCVDYVSCEEDITNFYAIIGKVIKVKEKEHTYYCNMSPFDAKYQAKLKVLDQVYGNYKKDTITFTAYDHYGRPDFADFKTVLIYVVESCGELYHVKHQYSPVSKVDCSWKVPYYKPKYKRDSLLTKKLKPMKFEDSLSFKFSYLYSEEELNETYPEPYFYRKGAYVLPLYGYDVEDVFGVLRQTLFTHYGYFKD